VTQPAEAAVTLGRMMPRKCPTVAGAAWIATPALHRTAAVAAEAVDVNGVATVAARAKASALLLAKA